MRIFSIPDYDDFFINKYLLKGKQEHQDWFYDNFAINSVYGCPPCCIWNGIKNTNAGEFYVPDSYMKGIVNFYHGQGLKFRLYYANTELQANHAKDLYGNTLANLLNEIGGDVIVSNETMWDRMKQYARLNRVWSDLLDYGMDEEDIAAKINRLSESNTLILPYYLIRKTQMLSKLLFKQNIELQVGACCRGDTSLCREHRQQIGLFNIYERENTRCLLYGGGEKEIIDSNLSLEEIGKLEKAGFQRFMINCFEIDNQKMLDTYLYFFVKPECGEMFVDYLNESIKKEIEQKNNSLLLG